VFLSEADLRRLLKRLRLDFKGFFKDYCILVDAGNGMALSLRDVRRRSGPGGTGQSYDCVFWREGGCEVYEDRPLQCTTYPFWASIVDSEESWRDEAGSCPGIGAGELWSRTHIDSCISARREAGTLLLAYGVDPESADENTILGGSRLGPDAPDAVEGQE
jgi:Fe-S-cluster containining protein